MGSLLSTLNHDTANDAIPYAPWQIIPSELWSTIFAFCLSPDPSYEDDPIEEALRDPRLTPITLASVCQVWRNIACGTPELWSTCWVSYSHPELNTVWLNRSGTRMLHIYGRYYGYTRTDYNWRRLVESILPFQTRWKFLQIDLGNWGIKPSVPELETRALETFKLAHECEMPTWMTSIFSKSPNLRELDLYRLGSGTPHSIVDSSLPLLSRLTIGWATPLEILLVLSRFPQLQYLSAVVGPGEPVGMQSFDDASPITHTGLVDLRLNGAFRSNGSLMINKLTLPSLRTLHMAYNLHPDSFLSFIRRSRCRILELNVSRHGLWDAEVIQTLQDSFVHRWVETLEIPGIKSFIAPKVLELLNDYDYFPHLTSLSLRSKTYTHVPDGALADLVISRSEPRICECEDCTSHSRAREVYLRHIQIGHFHKGERGLDIARLVPLPGDKAVDFYNIRMIIDLILADRDSQNIPVQYLLGWSPDTRRGFVA